jgi:hypothetical protein
MKTHLLLFAFLFVCSYGQGQILISDAVLVGKTNGTLLNAVQLKKTSMGDSSWYNLIYPYSDSDQTYFSTLDFKATEDDMQLFYQLVKKMADMPNGTRNIIVLGKSTLVLSTYNILVRAVYFYPQQKNRHSFFVTHGQIDKLFGIAKDQ